MYVLGLAGGPATMLDRSLSIGARSLSHDSAAVLSRNGHVVAAVEEERLNRVKHSNLFPEQSIKFCLDQAGITIDEVSSIAFYLNEDYLDHVLDVHQKATGRLWRAKELVSARIAGVVGRDVADKLIFVDHHYAHAFSTFPYSAGEESLVLILDNAGEFSSGLIGKASGGRFEKLAHIKMDQSLGAFYLNAIAYLGLGMFDEYKAMGLAPYGDPAVYRKVFEELFLLKDKGQFQVASETKMAAVLGPVIPLAASSDEVMQCHRDLAATLQEALEKIVFHILRHWKAATGLKHLCLAGGVAHNCTMNGKIMQSGLFDSVFVQPAAHDAGCALGAANYALLKHDPDFKIPHFSDVNWGPGIPDADALGAILATWGDWVEFRKSDDVVTETAQFLADGAVIGWVQGGSEFGPRALGNRSILADPRPFENRARINFMIKKREGFRPFAPSVTQESAATYFELNGKLSPYMSYVLPVRQQYREKLAAISHVDGTARVQTVSQETNPRYFALLSAMGERIGVPMLLNTSFNNNVEPIVNSVEDAICCYLTTGLDKLVVGDYIVSTRAAPMHESLRNAHVQLTPYARLAPATDEDAACVQSPLANKRVPVGSATYALLAAGSENASITFSEATAGSAEAIAIADEIRLLWEKRLIEIRPVA